MGGFHPICQLARLKRPSDPLYEAADACVALALRHVASNAAAPNTDEAKHDRQRDPEAGIERDLCLGGEDAAECSLPLRPVVDDA